MKPQPSTAFLLLSAALFLAWTPGVRAGKKTAPEAQTITHHVFLHVDTPKGGEKVEVILSPVTEEKQAVPAVAEKPAPKPAAPAAPATAGAAAPEGAGGTETSSTNMGLLFFVFVLAIFLGLELISKVPSQLHTPLMSGSNAISGITIVGALVAAGTGHGRLMVLLGTLAVAFAMINVVGGYMVTDRMLAMFKHKEKGPAS